MHGWQSRLKLPRAIIPGEFNLKSHTRKSATRNWAISLSIRVQRISSKINLVPKDGAPGQRLDDCGYLSTKIEVATNLDGFRAIVARNLNKTRKWRNVV